MRKLSSHFGPVQLEAAALEAYLAASRSGDQVRIAVALAALKDAQFVRTR